MVKRFALPLARAGVNEGIEIVVWSLDVVRERLVPAADENSEGRQKSSVGNL